MIVYDPGLELFRDYRDTVSRLPGHSRRGTPFPPPGAGKLLPLQRAATDAEPLFDLLSCLRSHLMRIHGSVLDNMGRKGGLGGTHGPDVQIMDFDNAGKAFQVIADPIYRFLHCHLILL
jgi:hypothetical protein